MTSFYFLYEPLHQTPLKFDQLEDRVLMGLELVKEMEEYMQSIRHRLKEAHD
jgi:hypothetical protein